MGAGLHGISQPLVLSLVAEEQQIGHGNAINLLQLLEVLFVMETVANNANVILKNVQVSVVFDKILK